MKLVSDQTVTFLSQFLALKAKNNLNIIQEQMPTEAMLETHQQTINDLLWYSPNFLKLLTANDFFKIWLAML